MGLAYLCNGLSYANEPPKFVAMTAFLPCVGFLLMINHVRFAVPYGCERGREPGCQLGAHAGRGAGRPAGTAAEPHSPESVDGRIGSPCQPRSS